MQETFLLKNCQKEEHRADHKTLKRLNETRGLSVGDFMPEDRSPSIRLPFLHILRTAHQNRGHAASQEDARGRRVGPSLEYRMRGCSIDCNVASALV